MLSVCLSVSLFQVLLGLNPETRIKPVIEYVKSRGVDAGAVPELLLQHPRIFEYKVGGGVISIGCYLPGICVWVWVGLVGCQGLQVTCVHAQRGDAGLSVYAGRRVTRGACAAVHLRHTALLHAGCVHTTHCSHTLTCAPLSLSPSLPTLPTPYLPTLPITHLSSQASPEGVNLVKGAARIQVRLHACVVLHSEHVNACAWSLHSECVVAVGCV